MNNPLVTILSPCYNVEQFLSKYFETVLGQTYTNLQIVLIDDGSKDKTWSVLQEYSAKDSRVEVYHQENQGVAPTRNNLLDKVKGDYVLFVDSDDWIELDMVEGLLSLANEYHSDFIMCDRVVNDTKPRTSPQCIHRLSQEEAIHDFLRHEYFIGSLWNKLLGSSLLHNVRFHCGISYGEDALFCWHVLQNTNNVIVTDRQLYHYCMNPNSLSHNAWTPYKKGSGHIVWEAIASEAEKWWPKYQHIAKAKFVIEDMWGLYYASLAKYPYDEHIKMRQINIKENFSLIKPSGLINRKKIFTAFILSHFYWLGRFLKYTR